MPSRVLTTAGVAAILLASACSNPSTDPSVASAPNSTRAASAKTSAATTVTKRPTVVHGTGYSVTLPAGWVNEKDAEGRDLSAYDSRVSATSRGLTVSITPLEGEITATRVAAWVLDGLKKSKGQDVTTEKLGRLGGFAGQRFSATMPGAGKKKVRLVRQVVEYRGNAYVVSISGPADKSVEQVLAINKDLLDSWAWKT